jgi:TonB family protein
MRESMLGIVMVSASISLGAAEPSIGRCNPMPKVIEAAIPEYPVGMHHFKGGQIVVEFTLHTGGTVEDPEIVESDIEHRDAEELYTLTRAAALKWRFESPSRTCRGRMPITFRFQE